MKDPIAVHVVHRLDELVHVALHAVLSKVVPPPPDQLVDVPLHELEHQGQSARGLVVQYLDEADDVGVR